MSAAHAIWLAGVLALAAACTPASAGRASGDGRPPIALTVPAANSGAPHLAGTSVEVDQGAPAAVAADLVFDGLTEQGLSVVGIDTELVDHRDGVARVRVAVVHSIGRGHPHQSLYTIELEPAGAGWRAAGFTETAG